VEVIDIFAFNNEFEMLDLRVKILEDVVDRFIIKEGNITYQGGPKECLAHLYKHPKVTFMTVELPEKATPWERDFYHMAYPADLTGVSKDSLILLSQIDEVPHPGAVEWLKSNLDQNTVYGFEQTMYQYYLNVENLDEHWVGTRACSHEFYKNNDGKKIRYNIEPTRISKAGWHWTFLGGEELIKNKIQSYAHAEFNNLATLSKVSDRIENNEDVFGRGFNLKTVQIDETYPEYIRNNKEKLSNLIKDYE
jgi:beta-1,4-mannosyl-glycoprotein beta-1,4-N-acetylglucosaminyltransferase